jgi:hypothetical protein
MLGKGGCVAESIGEKLALSSIPEANGCRVFIMSLIARQSLVVNCTRTMGTALRAKKRNEQ